MAHTALRSASLRAASLHAGTTSDRVLVPAEFHPPFGAALPTFRRRDITWRWADAKTLEVSIELRNETNVPTDPAVLVVDVAGFGAFIPFAPGTRIAVGGMDPRERRTARGTIPSARLPRTNVRVAPSAFARLIAGIISGRAETCDETGLLRRWVGNVNVYFDRHADAAVERHTAFGLTVPTRSVSHFHAATMSNDLRWLEARVSDPDWAVEASLVGSSHVLISVTSPDAGGRSCDVVVELTREPDGRTVPIEWSFDTSDTAATPLGHER